MKKKTLEEELELTEIPDPVLEECDVESKTSEEDLEIDYKEIRKHMYKGMIRASEVLDEAVKMVKKMPLPKQIEATGSVLKTLTENAEKLLDMHEKIQKIEAREKGEKEQDSSDKAVVLKGNLRDITAILKDRAENE